MPASPSSTPPVPGEVFGPYRIVRLLGAGGMGTVYEAHDTALGREVALKLIAPHLADDPDLRTRFVREARAQASLDSPHVVQVFAHGEAHGRLFTATQLVRDGDLAAWLRRHGPPSPDRAVHLVAQVAEGLVEAHRAGLVHRDVKPSNVLLRHRGPDTVAYLADFGVATSEGTPAEDVAALGRLLWTTLTGGCQDATRPTRRIRTVRRPGAGAWGHALDRVLARALTEDPQRRYPSAAALRDDLRALDRTPRRAAADPRRRFAGAVGAAVGALGALGAVGVVTALTPGDPAGPAVDRGPSDLVRVLQEDAGLDAAAAACTARRLGHDDDPAAAFAAAFSCLWPAGAPGGR